MAATAGRDGLVRVWDLSSGRPLHEFEGHSYYWPGMLTIAFSPDGKSLAIAYEQKLKIRNVETGQLERQLENEGKSFSCVCYAPNGLDVAAGCTDGTLVRWDTKTGEARQELQTGSASERVFRLIDCVKFSPDGQSIATGHRNGALFVWNHTTSTLLYEYKSALKDRVSALAFSDTGQLAVAWGDHLEFLQAEDGHSLGQVNADTVGVLSLAYLPGRSQLLIPGIDQMIRRYDTQEMSEKHVFRGHQAAVLCVAVSSDGNTIVSSDDKGVLRIWKAVDPETVPTAVQSLKDNDHSNSVATR